MNWADPRDNYADDEVVPSGSAPRRLPHDVPQGRRHRAGFQQELGANTIRLPINPSSVGHRLVGVVPGAIDAAVGRGVKVILSYWEADNTKDGRVDDPAAFDDDVGHRGRRRTARTRGSTSSR